MTALWLVTGVALLVAIAAWRSSRRTARRLQQLSEMYWELKYQHAELRTHLERRGVEAQPVTTPVPPAKPPDVFVPLASLRR